MLKSFKTFVLLTLLLSFAKNLDTFDSKKTIFTPGKIKTYSNGLNDVENAIEIKFKSGDEKMIVGDGGVLHFKTDFNNTSLFDLSTIEQDSVITPIAWDENDFGFQVTCRLWITSDYKISLFCNLDGQCFNEGEHNITIDDGSSHHNDFSFWISFPLEGIKIEQFYYEIPFLYSDIQSINIVESQPSYELKFKIEQYNNDTLYIHGTKYNYAILDSCEKKSQELICKLTKEKIEQILILNNEPFTIGTMNDFQGLIKFKYVSDIKINYNSVTKENIYIQIEQLVGGITETGTPFAFETNITSFPNFISDIYQKDLYFKKMPGKPLMMFVEGTEIDIQNYQGGCTFNNIHYKYNFIIKPFEIHGNISIEDK